MKCFRYERRKSHFSCTFVILGRREKSFHVLSLLSHYVSNTRGFYLEALNFHVQNVLHYAANTDVFCQHKCSHAPLQDMKNESHFKIKVFITEMKTRVNNG